MLSWFCCIVCAKFGFIMSMAVHSLQPSINWAGAQLVVQWGVVQYVKRNLCNFCLNVPFSFVILFIEFLKIWTVLLACPCYTGRCGAVCICRIPFCWRNFSNLKLVNGLLLSITIFSGSPKFAKRICNFSFILSDVAWTVGIMV